MGLLGHVTWTIFINSCSLFRRGHRINLALIGNEVSGKMSGNNGHINVHVCWIFAGLLKCHDNNFPVQTHRHPNLTLP